VAFLNLFAAYSTTSDKRKVLQMADAFSYNVRGFKATWRDLMELFKILHHTAMTTASHLYIHHRSEQWSDTKKINFAIDMFIKADQQWVLEALTRPGAENITTIVAAGEYLSTHVAEDGPVGDVGAVHALTRGRRGGPIQCYGCQETGHIISNCPHQAQGASALGATLAYNQPSAPQQRYNTSAQDMAREMEVTRRLEEASLAERRMDASTQKFLQLCERDELACDRITAAAAAERTSRELHTLSLPQGEARGHKTMTRQDDVEEMAHAMEAACRCEIVADDTPALDADWGKFHNPWENAWPRQVKRWGEGREAD